jgi:SprT protein
MRSFFKQLESSWLPKKIVSKRNRTTKNDIDTELTLWCSKTAQCLELPDLAKHVTVFWNSKMRTTAGRAWFPNRIIELNPKIQEFEGDEKWRTIRHELAHLIAYERAGKKRIEPHGIEWRNACAELGIPNESVCHNLPLKRRTLRKKFTYTCPKCFSEIKRVKKIRRIIACYPCCKKYNGGNYDSTYRLIQKLIQN